jgi:tol-pal system protein YbgF
MVRLLALTLAFAVATPVAAQDRAQTLADIRQEMSVLWVEIQNLRREMSTTGGPQTNLQGTSIPDRVNAIEAELARLTARTEELSNRIDRIVADGTNRIGDLEFRLVELEGGDVSRLGETSTLGGGSMPAVTAPAPALPAAQPPSAGGGAGPELAMGEQMDFDQAKGALDRGEYELAAAELARFTETYPGSPLAGEAHFWRGEALSALGDSSGAARAYLDSFSGDPQGMMAADALLQLGLALDRLGQRQESCVMLGEVTVRFPASAASVEAQAARGSMGCV